MAYKDKDKYPLLINSNFIKTTRVKIVKVPFSRVRSKRTLYFLVFAFFICATIVFQISLLFPHLLSSVPELPFLINTPTCQVKDWPLFDEEILPLYENLKNVDFNCDKNAPLFTIQRVNFTWLYIDYSKNSNWSCNATELARNSDTDGLALGPTITNLETYTNFDRNQIKIKLKNSPYENVSRWDSVQVDCKSSDKSSNKTLKYSRVVPLVQFYQPENSNSKPKVNIILLGIDSISRLNFLRHMHQTKKIFDINGFIPLYGHHKVGENSFPNILPMFTGHLSTYYYNDSAKNEGFKFDSIKMIFHDAKKAGYLTTFIEDMPPYGFFTARGGFTKQLTHYYLRPTNLAIWDKLYYTYSCYQERIEHELYWDYLLDLFQAFQSRSNTVHFTFAHMSTLTHNYFNHAGYADKPFSSFMEKLFTGGHHQNSVIMVYSDHALRFGDAVNTTSNVHEQRLPFFYIYIPDTLTLNGLNADNLRDIVRANQHSLTSHLDMHATMLHILKGNVPTASDTGNSPGRSLLTPIPFNRTCASAGIPPQYCLCDAYKPMQLSESMREQSLEVVQHINHLMASHGNYCVPLETTATYRAFDSSSTVGLGSQQSKHQLRLIHFATSPNDAIFEAILRIDPILKRKIIRIENISRITRYDDESSCVADKLDIVQFCLCWDKLK